MRPPPPEIKWDVRVRDETRGRLTLRSAAWEVIRFVFTGKESEWS